MAASTPEEPDYPAPTVLEIHDARSLRWQRRWDERRARLIKASTDWLNAKRIEWASQPTDILSRSYIRGPRPDGYGSELDDALFLLRPSDEAIWPGAICGICLLLLAETVPNGAVFRMPCAEDKAHVSHRDCVVKATSVLVQGGSVICPWDTCGNVYEHLETFPFEEKVDLHNVDRKFSSAAPSSSMTGGYSSPWFPGSRKAPKPKGQGGGGGGGGDGGGGGGKVPSDDDGPPPPSDDDDGTAISSSSDRDDSQRPRSTHSDDPDSDDSAAWAAKKARERRKRLKREKEEAAKPKKTNDQWKAELAAKIKRTKLKNKRWRDAKAAAWAAELRRKPMVQFDSPDNNWVTIREFYDFDFLPKEYTGRNRRVKNRKKGQMLGWENMAVICEEGDRRICVSRDKAWIQERQNKTVASQEYDTLSESEFQEDQDGKLVPKRRVKQKKQSAKKKAAQENRIIRDALRRIKKGKNDRIKERKKRADRRESNRKKRAGELSPTTAGKTRWWPAEAIRSDTDSSDFDEDRYAKHAP